MKPKPASITGALVVVTACALIGGVCPAQSDPSDDSEPAPDTVVADTNMPPALSIGNSSPYSLGVDLDLTGSGDPFQSSIGGGLGPDPNYSQVMSGLQGIVNNGIRSGESEAQMQQQFMGYLNGLFGDMDAGSSSPSLLSSGAIQSLGQGSLAPSFFTVGAGGGLSQVGASFSSGAPDAYESIGASKASSPPSSATANTDTTVQNLRSQFDGHDYQDTFTSDNGSERADCSGYARREMQARNLGEQQTLDNLNSTGLADYLGGLTTQFTEVSDPSKAVKGGYIYFEDPDGNGHIEATEGVGLDYQNRPAVLTWGCRRYDSGGTSSENTGCGQGEFNYQWLNNTPKVAQGSIRVFIPSQPASSPVSRAGNAQADALSNAALQTLSSGFIPF